MGDNMPHKLFIRRLLLSEVGKMIDDSLITLRFGNHLSNRESGKVGTFTLLTSLANKYCFSPLSTCCMNRREHTCLLGK